MSTLPPKAGTPSGDREVRFVPTADKMVRRGAMSALLSPKIRQRTCPEKSRAHPLNDNSPPRHSSVAGQAARGGNFYSCGVVSAPINNAQCDVRFTPENRH
jgi:hypothetical protein